jgi:SAM-dependent methyltransferase
MRHATGDRWDLIAELIGVADSVLDIGCRDKALQSHLPPTTRYVGLDLAPPADVIASAEDPLPFDDDSVDVAVLADVLEHLNRPHEALREAMRVATTGVVVLLPNLFFYQHRIGILRGRLNTEKYDMCPTPSEDRHRWFIHFDHARAFAAGVAQSVGWSVGSEVAYDGGPQRAMSRAIMIALPRMTSPAVWAFEYGARLIPRV